MLFLVIPWYGQMIVYLISFGISLSMLSMVDWHKILAPKFHNGNWGIVFWIMCSFAMAYLIGSMFLIIFAFG